MLLAMLVCSLASGGSLPGVLQRPADTLRLYAVGDINLGRRIAKERLESGDTLYPFAALLDTLRGADILFGNLESPIAPAGHEVERAGLVFTAPPVAAAALARAGFAIVSTANNHAWDGGRAGLAETIDRLGHAGVRCVGTGFGRPMAQAAVMVRRRGWRVAFFAVTRAFNAELGAFYSHEGANYVAWGDTTWLHPALRALKASGRADFVVVSVHGGEEYTAEPRPEYAAFLAGLVDAGADLVIGHHPHVLQPVVWRRAKPIVPSLANFIFAQEEPWAQLSAILRVVVAPDGSVQLSAIPVRAGLQAQLAPGPAADSIGRRLGIRLSTTDTVP